MKTALALLLLTSTLTAAPFAIFKDGVVPEIRVSTNDYPQIGRAAGDLQRDIERVTGLKPALIPSDEAAPAILAGSIEKSPFIRALIEAGKLDPARSIAGKREAFYIGEVDGALVIAGNDMRGTIYGIYAISERIGVSPFYWWSDVPPRRRSEIILTDPEMLADEAAVRYRGIFINDEKNFRNWSIRFKDDFSSPGQPSLRTYEKVFELLLRLRLNTLWPAMHPYSDAFNAFTDPSGQSYNARLAHNYGIIMGSSHCENMLRNNVGEWEAWANRNRGRFDAKGKPLYDYTLNPLAVEAYWRERIQKNGAYENIYTLGMRGIHDSGMTFNGLKNPTLEEKVAVLQTIITRQREILTEELKRPIGQIPQVFIPYKEAAEYYNAGLEIPPDVTLMFCDDNHGYIRQLPTPAERTRPGGAGIYSHASYWGPPRSYLWVSTTPPGLIAEEFQKAHATGAGDYWILNVGDIKPAEILLATFARVAQRPAEPLDLPAFYRAFAIQNFGADSSQAADAAAILADYYRLAIAKRPEFFGFERFDRTAPLSLVNENDEAQRLLEAWRLLLARATRLHASLAADRQDAFYETVLYPIRACAFTAEKYVNAWHADLYRNQGRFESVAQASERSRAAYETILADIATFNALQGGKWQGILNPYVNDIPKIDGALNYPKLISSARTAGIGAVCEGQTTGKESITLRFAPGESRFIDVFNRGLPPSAYTLTLSHPWLITTKTAGKADPDERIWVSIDWEKLPPGDQSATITISGGAFEKTFPVRVTRTPGAIAIKAEAFTEAIPADGCHWRKVAAIGRGGDAMKIFPDTAPQIDDPTQGAKLTYRIDFPAAGTFKGTLHRIPTLREEGKCRIAIGLEGQEPQILKGENSAAKKSTAWKRNALEHIEKLPFEITVDQPGPQTLVVYQVSPGIIFDRIIINTGDERPSYFGPMLQGNSTCTF